MGDDTEVGGDMSDVAMKNFLEAVDGKFEVCAQAYSGALRRRFGVGGGLRRYAEQNLLKSKRAKRRGKCRGDRRAQRHRECLSKQVRRAVASAREKGTWRRLREKTQVHKTSPQKSREAKQTQAVHLGVEQINAAVHELNQEKEKLAEREAQKAAAVDELRAEKYAYTQAAQLQRPYEDAIVNMNNTVAGSMMWTHLPEETREAIRARLGLEGKILRLHVV